MNDLILFLHFFGLVLAGGGGLATGMLMRRAANLSPDQAAPIRALGPSFANVTAVGVALLWASGVILVWSKWSGFGSLPALFWVKFAFVLLMTLFVVLVQVTYAQMRRTGNQALGARLAKFGPASGFSALLAIVFAAFAFH